MGQYWGGPYGPNERRAMRMELLKTILATAIVVGFVFLVVDGGGWLLNHV